MLHVIQWFGKEGGVVVDVTGTYQRTEEDGRITFHALKRKPQVPFISLCILNTTVKGSGTKESHLQNNRCLSRPSR